MTSFKQLSHRRYIVRTGPDMDYLEAGLLIRYDSGWLWETDEGAYEPALLRAIADKLDELNLAAQRTV